MLSWDEICSYQENEWKTWYFSARIPTVDLLSTSPPSKAECDFSFPSTFMPLENFKLFKTLKVYYLLEGCNVIARCHLKSCLSVWATLFWIPAPAQSEKMYIYLSVVVSNCLRSILLFFLHGPSPRINVWWCTEHWNHLCIISRLFLFCHLHRDGQPCVWGISLSLPSLITLCVCSTDLGINHPN